MVSGETGVSAVSAGLVIVVSAVTEGLAVGLAAGVFFLVEVASPVGDWERW